MTNEEWIKSLNTEQLAEQLVDSDNEYYMTSFNGLICSTAEDPKVAVDKTVEWLKKEHDPEDEFWWHEVDDKI